MKCLRSTKRLPNRRKSGVKTEEIGAADEILEKRKTNKFKSTNRKTNKLKAKARKGISRKTKRLKTKKLKLYEFKAKELMDNALNGKELKTKNRKGKESQSDRVSKKVFISYDEKPGIQAIAMISPDLSPTLEHGFVIRDYEYRRHGTVSSRRTWPCNF
jgi:hypothetical protein